MRILLKNHTIRKSILLYRRFRYRKGHGVHSPFVFRLITRVIEEKSAYYAYDDIALIRKKMLYREESLRRYDLPFREGELLFRLVNYFKPVYILQIAPGELYSTLYLNAYSEQTFTYILQDHATLCTLSEKLFPVIYGDGIDIRNNIDEKRLISTLQEMPTVDFIYLDKIPAMLTLESIWEKIVGYKEDHTVVVIKGIHENSLKKRFWKGICEHPQTTVTVDLYKYGVVLFNKKLHKRTYKAHF